jgi:hypothetical protein
MVANGDCPVKGSGKCHRKQTVPCNGFAAIARDKGERVR